MKSLKVHRTAEDTPVVQDVDLLSLPEGVLQNIAQHFKLSEWVQGPASTCRLLHHLELPKVHLRCYKFNAVMP